MAAAHYAGHAKGDMAAGRMATVAATAMEAMLARRPLRRALCRAEFLDASLDITVAGSRGENIARRVASYSYFARILPLYIRNAAL
jgi:hypothetical protein